MPGPKPKLHMPFADWPEIDRRLWNAAVDRDDPFNDAARLAKRTLRKHWMGWRRFLGFIAVHEPDVLKRSPLQRLTAERLRRFVEHLRETNTSHSVAIQVDSLYGAARTMMPDKDWSWLRNIKTRLFAAAPRGNSVRPVITSLQLVDLGEKLMDESEVSGKKEICIDDAVRYRDGVMIALAGLIPLRHKNYAAIEIGRDFIKEGDSWSIVIPPEETKTKIWLDFPIPEFMENRLSIYLTRVRPRLLRRPDCQALWVSYKGGALSYSALGPVFTRHSTERLGIRITPHDARDAAATLWAIMRPEQVGISRDLLAHADLRMTTKYYNRAKGIEASRAHNRVIAQLKKKDSKELG
jgi:integrase/recombinase XerD